MRTPIILSGSQILKGVYPEAVVAIGEKITAVQSVFKDVFGLLKISKLMALNLTGYYAMVKSFRRGQFK